MDYSLTFDFFNRFWRDDLVIIYSGHFNDKSLISLTDIIGLHYEINNNENRYKGRFVYLTVETFQNVIRYANLDLKKVNLSDYNNLFIARKIDDDFFISTANPIGSDSERIISNRIDEINELKEEELNKKYKEVLLNQAFTKQGGAGLGFIEMSRKTKQKLQYTFENVNKDVLIYYLFLKFLSPESIEFNIDNFSENSSKDIYKIISANNLILFIKHEFNESVNEAIFRSTELNMVGVDIVKKKIVFQLSVEALQNISKHAHVVEGKKEGIFYLQKVKDEYIVTTGNYIHIQDVDYINNFLKELKNTERKDLAALYLQALTTTEEFDGNGGLGFIDIARDSKEFNYKFFNINENYSFFVLSFKV